MLCIKCPQKLNNMKVCFFSLQDFVYFVFNKTKQNPQEIQMERKQPFYASVLRTWWMFFFLRQIPLLSQFWQVQLEFCYISTSMQHLLMRKIAFSFWIRYIVRIILKKHLSVFFWFRQRLQSQRQQFLLLSFDCSSIRKLHYKCWLQNCILVQFLVLC